MSRLKVKNPVDMSAAAEDRGRRRQQGTVGGAPPAQMSHAQGSRGARWRRDGENKFAATEFPREAVAVPDHREPAAAPSLDDTARETLEA